MGIMTVARCYLAEVGGIHILTTVFVTSQVGIWAPYNYDDGMIIHS